MPKDVTAESIVILDDDVIATAPEIAESDIIEELCLKQKAHESFLMPQFSKDINFNFLQSFFYLELSLSRTNYLVPCESEIEKVHCIF